MVGLDVSGAETEPLELVIRQRIPGALSRSEAGLAGVLPSLRERSWLGAPPVERRSSPFEIAFPIHLTSRVRIEPPSGYRIESEPIAAASGRYLRWNQSSSKEGSALVLALELQRSAGAFPSDSYDAYRRELESAFSGLERPVVLHRE